MTSILIYCPENSPRLQYVLEEIFRFRLSVDYQLCSDHSFFQSARGAKLHYSSTPCAAGEVWIPSSRFLFESGLTSPLPETLWLGQTPALFPVHTAHPATWPFDLFAMAFFLLSRYEEYLPAPKDMHARFPASASLAAQQRFLETPLLDVWVARLAQKLATAFPGFPVSLPAFAFLPTFDIDQAWAFRHKPLWRQLGGALQSLWNRRFIQFFHRISVWMSWEKDPFDTFSFLLDQHKAAALQPLFFFLMADPGPYDKNNPYNSPALQGLIQTLSTRVSIGLHPSYQSAEDPRLVIREKERLEQISGRGIRKSRQHFLRLHFPSTYRTLIHAGIEEDYSMGYADAVGFRAGTAVPFYWYDLEKECPTSLRVHPFQAMDVTLRQYLSLSPEEAIEKLTRLRQIIQTTGGQFCTIWHNSSFDEKGDWHGWTKVYLHLVKESQNLPSK
ncbi:MAG: polysaccharide deacetylase family protein [Saprospirales bacterium]|nr:polysaccharide deacetylase family protein [Saprospirales bacterium]